MNANGVLGSMCFPSFPQFCGQLFSRTEDKDVALAMLRAYNDWHIDEWCGYVPGPLHPAGLPAIWDPELMAAEVRRVAAKGCHAITFSENPEKLGWPSFHSDHWDPFWAGVRRRRAPSSACTSGRRRRWCMTAADAPINVMITLQPMNLVQARADLLWSRVFHEVPRPRFALSEGGIGWIPYFLERADYVYQHHQDWTGTDFGGRLPSEVFREHGASSASSTTRRAGEPPPHRRRPHHAGSATTRTRTPRGRRRRELLSKSLDGIPDDEINKITHENAMRLFQYDPFAHRPREKATVGALRAEAAGVDVEIKGSGKAPRDPSEGPITIVDIINAAGANLKTQ